MGMVVMDMEVIMENEQNKSLEEIGVETLAIVIDDVWRGIKRFYWLFLVIISIYATMSYVRASKFYTPIYTAYTSFVVSTNTAYGYSETYYNKTTAVQMSKTFPYILTSGVLSDVVAADLGLSSVPASISAESTGENALFTLKVTSSDPQMAYDVLQSVIKNYPIVAEYIIGTTQLTKMDESGVPTEPINEPNFMAQAESGATFGVGISIFLLLLYVVSRHTVRREEDLKSRFSFSFLGSIPVVRLKKRSKVKEKSILLTNKSVSMTLGEPMRTIRTRFVKELQNNEMNCIMITSSISGEGKSTTAVNLALSLAHKGSKVVLVDCDLRHPSVASILGVKSEYGIIDFLQGKAVLNDVIKTVTGSSLLVVPGVNSIKNPTELLSSTALKDLIAQLSEEAEYVIVDTPPCTMMSDASIIANLVQGVVMVVRQDYARIERIVSGVENLADSGATLIGYVLNGTEAGITGYGYGYGYGKYGYGKYGYGYGQKKATKDFSEYEDETKEDETYTVSFESVGEIKLPDED